MNKSRKWVVSAVVAVSMAMAGTASALDDALVDQMVAAINAATQQDPDVTNNNAALSQLLLSNPAFNGKVDELIQALADARIADAVALQVIQGSSQGMTIEQAVDNFAAAKIVTASKADNFQNPQPQSDGGNTNNPFVNFGANPSNSGAGTGTSRT